MSCKNNILLFFSRVLKQRKKTCDNQNQVNPLITRLLQCQLITIYNKMTMIRRIPGVQHVIPNVKQFCPINNVLTNGVLLT